MIEHANRSAASHHVAQHLAQKLSEALCEPGEAALVLSGGSTPVQTIKKLATQDLDWARVVITLTDERCVPADHPDSNTAMVLGLLAGTPASGARFVNPNGADGRTFPRPAASLVGMGADGHFASLFPDAENLAAAMALSTTQRWVEVSTAASPHARVSQTLAALIDTNHLILLAFGDDKRALLMEPGELPVAALLRQTETPVDVHWAP